jgi:hypothetical protein
MAEDPHHPLILVMSEFFFTKLRCVPVNAILLLANIHPVAKKVYNQSLPTPKKKTSLNMDILWSLSIGKSMSSISLNLLLLISLPPAEITGFLL